MWKMGKSWEHVGNSQKNEDLNGKLIENLETKWGFQLDMSDCNRVDLWKTLGKLGER